MKFVRIPFSFGMRWSELLERVSTRPTVFSTLLIGAVGLVPWLAACLVAALATAPASRVVSKFEYLISVSAAETARALLLLLLLFMAVHFAAAFGFWLLRVSSLRRLRRAGAVTLTLFFEMTRSIAWTVAFAWPTRLYLAFGGVHRPALVHRFGRSENYDTVLIAVPGTWNKGSSATRMLHILTAIARRQDRVSVFEAQWLGANDELVRRAAARQLASAIVEKVPVGRIILVGHSHGGSVACLAAQEVGARASVITLGTPFVTVLMADTMNARTKPIFWAYLMACLIPTALLLLYFQASRVQAFDMFPNAVASVFNAVGIPFGLGPLESIALLGAVAVPALYFVHHLDALERARQFARAKPSEAAGRIDVLRAEGDQIFQAIAALASALRACSDWAKDGRQIAEAAPRAVLSDLLWLTPLPAIVATTLVCIDAIARRVDTVGAFMAGVQSVSLQWFGSLHFFGMFIVVACWLAMAKHRFHSARLLAIGSMHVLTAIPQAVLAWTCARFIGLPAGVLPYVGFRASSIPVRSVATTLCVSAAIPTMKRGLFSNPHGDILWTADVTLRLAGHVMERLNTTGVFDVDH